MSIPEKEKASSKQVSEIEELDEKNIEKVSGAGLGGLIAGAKNAMEAASGIGGTTSQILRAGIKGANSGAAMNTETAKLEGAKVGQDLVRDERYKQSLGK